ncbi:MAG: hypothetical protein R6V54_14515 [Desulfobacteraceae bacterium]
MVEELVTRKAVSVQETQRAFLKQWNDFEESGTVTPLADIFLESEMRKILAKYINHSTVYGGGMSW